MEVKIGLKKWAAGFALNAESLSRDKKMKRQPCCAASYAEGYKDGVIQDDPYCVYWKSVDHLLPENKQIVLTINEHGELHVCKYEVSGDKYYFMLNETSHQVTKVKYWSNLPKHDIVIEVPENATIIPMA